ncbi:MAG: hypothetical protein ACRD2A_09280, partial [Vicinamibacterales bacterium]
VQRTGRQVGDGVDLRVRHAQDTPSVDLGPAVALVLPRAGGPGTLSSMARVTSRYLATGRLAWIST